MKINTSILSLILLIVSMGLSAQTPDFYPPTNPDPVEFTLLNIFLYIILPLLLIVAFLLYRRSKKKKAREKEKNR